jgi:ABC-2 type transport system permease protein
MSAVREYWRVFCLHLRMQMNLSALSARMSRPSGKEILKMAGYGLLILYCLGAILAVYSFVVFPFMKAAAEVEKALGVSLLMPLMGTIVLFCMIVVMIFGTLTLLSLVFSAKDAEAYAALPLREQSVFAAKFSIAYGIELGVTALILWPAVIIYGMVSSLTAAEFAALILRALPVWFLLPMAPMAFAALISMLFTRLMAYSRRRDVLLMIFGMALVFGMVAGQGFLMGRVGSMMDGEAPEVIIAKLLSDNSFMLEAVTDWFPPVKWCAQALIEQNAGKAAMGFLGMTASAAAGGGICLLLSRRLYYKGVLAQLEAPKSKRRGSSKINVKTGSTLKAFFTKEMKVILRTPVYAMNILTGVAIFPIMFFLMSVGSAGMVTGDIKALVASIAGPDGGDMLYLLAAAVVTVTAIMGSTGVSTTFSREGRMLWISQTAPVPVRTQVAARLLAGFVLTMAGAVLSMIVLVSFAGFSPGHAVFGLVLGACTAFPMLAASVLPDALKPKRKWNSEAEAIKQNMNSVLALLICMGMAVAIGMGVFFLQMLLPAVWLTGIAAAVICLAAGTILFGYTARVAEVMMRDADG